MIAEWKRRKYCWDIEPGGEEIWEYNNDTLIQAAEMQRCRG